MGDPCANHEPTLPRVTHGRPPMVGTGSAFSTHGRPVGDPRTSAAKACVTDGQLMEQQYVPVGDPHVHVVGFDLSQPEKHTL